MIAARGFQDRTVAIFGLGRSGLAAARSLMAGGARLRAWDDDPARRAAAAAEGVALFDLTGENWRGIDGLVLSPGVPLTHPAPHPVVERARAAGAEIIGDIELFFRAVPAARKTLVTGTNGKSTTTALIAHVLAHAGRAVEMGGNIGQPALALAPLAGEGEYVLEISSYQIDLTPSLHADVGVLLNISADHLDRHGSIAGYVAVKRRLFDGQSAGDVAVVGLDDAYCREIHADLGETGRQRVIAVSAAAAVDGGVGVVDGVLHDAMDGASSAGIDLSGAAGLPGIHNWQNAAAAYAACRALGVPANEVAAGLMSFPGLAHRMERVGELEGVQFINDSKATNADAAARALACYDKIYWIAGGRAKAGGIDALTPFHGRIRHAFLIGEAAAAFAEGLEGRVEATISGDLTSAVADAFALARRDRGAVVLLSPACASFDQFADFEARGEAFRAAVRRLAEPAHG